MSAHGMMTMRTTIERTSGVDGYGAPSSTWNLVATDVPVFAWHVVKGSPLIQRDQTVIEDLRAMIPLDTFVAEKDRLPAIKNRLDVVLFQGPFAVNAVERHVDHLELSLQRVKC